MENVRLQRGDVLGQGLHIVVGQAFHLGFHDGLSFPAIVHGLVAAEGLIGIGLVYALERLADAHGRLGAVRAVAALASGEEVLAVGGGRDGQADAQRKTQGKNDEQCFHGSSENLTGWKGIDATRNLAPNRRDGNASAAGCCSPGREAKRYGKLSRGKL